MVGIYLSGVVFTGLFISVVDMTVLGDSRYHMSITENLLYSLIWPFFWIIGLVVLLDR
jgi:hypothetical protein